MNGNELEILKALSAMPCTVQEIEAHFLKSRATLYRTLGKMVKQNWVVRTEGGRYALTEKGRQALKLLNMSI